MAELQQVLANARNRAEGTEVCVVAASSDALRAGSGSLAARASVDPSLRDLGLQMHTAGFTTDLLRKRVAVVGAFEAQLVQPTCHATVPCFDTSGEIVEDGEAPTVDLDPGLMPACSASIGYNHSSIHTTRAFVSSAPNLCDVRVANTDIHSCNNNLSSIHTTRALVSSGPNLGDVCVVETDIHSCIDTTRAFVSSGPNLAGAQLGYPVPDPVSILDFAVGDNGVATGLEGMQCVSLDNNHSSILTTRALVSSCPKLGDVCVANTGIHSCTDTTRALVSSGQNFAGAHLRYPVPDPGCILDFAVGDDGAATGLADMQCVSFGNNHSSFQTTRARLSLGPKLGDVCVANTDIHSCTDTTRAQGRN